MANRGEEAPAAADGTTDLDGLAAVLDDDVAGVVIQNPNYLGLVEPVDELAAATALQLGAQRLTLVGLQPTCLAIAARLTAP